MIFVVGLLSGFLASALVGLAVLFVSNRRAIAAALQHETRLLDRARAAELRSAQQIDAMLERINTSPRIEVREASVAPKADAESVKYIADTPYMDEVWNDYRGETEEAE